MKRIINGDVGSGKTLVSFFALYCATKSHHQGAMMAPTEILAKQHAINFDPIAKKLGINYALLTSSTKASEAKYIKNMLQLGEIDVIFGTQSILNEEIIFNDLSYGKIMRIKGFIKENDKWIKINITNNEMKLIIDMNRHQYWR